MYVNESDPRSDVHYLGSRQYVPFTEQKYYSQLDIYLYHFLELIIIIVTWNYSFQNFAWYSLEGWSLMP